MIELAAKFIKNLLSLLKAVTKQLLETVKSSKRSGLDSLQVR